MKENQFLGTLLPSHPDFLPIEKAIREKYGIAEVDPEEEPIQEIYLDGVPVPLEEFHKDIENYLRADLSFLPPELLKAYIPCKLFSETQHITQLEGIDLLPEDYKKSSDEIFKFVQLISNLIVQIIDPTIDSIVDMLYWYLLTGEAQELPNDWLSKVATIPMMDETIVMAMAGPMANPDVIAYQFREECKKAFGSYRPKLTNTITNTAYYLRLKKAGKPWNFIVEEFIRLNDYKLPRDRSSKKYQETLNRFEQRLKKRMQRTEKHFEILIRDKK
jgi:hypothetical protein